MFLVWLDESYNLKRRKWSWRWRRCARCASVNARKDLGRSSALIQFCAKLNFQYHRHLHHPSQVYLYTVSSFFWFALHFVYEIISNEKWFVYLNNFIKRFCRIFCFILKNLPQNEINFSTTYYGNMMSKLWRFCCSWKVKNQNGNRSLTSCRRST